MDIRKNFLLVFLLALLVTAQPVLAQEGEPTATVIPATEELSPTPPLDLGTPTAEPESQTPTHLPPTENGTPFISLEPTEPETGEPTLTSTGTTTIPPGTTAAPKTPEPACSTAGVFENQITVNTGEGDLPRLTFDHTIVSRSLDFGGDAYSVIEVDGQDFCAALDQLRDAPGVEYAEPNFSFSLLETYPNDAFLSQQYYLNNILAPQGWDYTTGSPAVTIAIIDTGVDTNHVDLAGKLTEGYDFVENDSYPQDEHGHGTFVAGVAAASTNNASGVAGVSWGAQIMPLRVLDRYGNGSYANAASAILWATDHGARVINMSIGGSNDSQVLRDAVDYALARGVVLVASTGNTGSPQVLFPAAFPGVIAVGATDAANQLTGFSNTGPQVDVVAPGVSILGLGLNSTYRISNGTSMSSPQVAGYAALLFSVPGVVYSSQVEEFITSTARDLGGAGYDAYYGYGLIQIGPGILSAMGLGSATPTPAVGHPENTATAISTATYVWFPPPARITPSTSPLLTEFEANAPTPTPGEIHILGEGGIVTPTLMSTALTAQPLDNSSEDKDNGSGFLWFGIGLLYIAASAGLFFYIRSRQWTP